MNFFVWEEKYKRTWEKPNTNEAKGKKRTLKPPGNYKKSLIRHLHISLDLSINSDCNDFLPSFKVIMNKSMESFAKQFQIQNPLSILTIKKMNSPFLLKQALNFDMSTYIREMVLVICSLSVKDGNVDDLIERHIQQNTKISIISFCGEVRLFSDICKRTGGTFHVPLDGDNFIDIINTFLVPRVSVNGVVSLIKMGFPTKTSNGVCICHLEHNTCRHCVKCGALVCVPCECKICGTLNVDSIMLFKNIYFMKYVSEYEIGIGVCICGKDGKRQCSCGQAYCEECSEFIHEYINFCISCSA